jgi:hypothetical protein
MRYPSNRWLNRRAFLAGTAGAVGASLLSSFDLEALAEPIARRTRTAWDPGRVRHLLPAASDSRILLKASFLEPLTVPPRLLVGNTPVPGTMSDSTGTFWQFQAAGLNPGASHTLALEAADGTSLCEPWALSTLPSANSQPEQLRVLFFTCAGGPPGSYDGIGRNSGFLPGEIRNRLLRRGLSYAPDLAVANGDHVYWDLHTWQGENAGQLSARGRESNFDFSERVLSGSNEAALRLAVDAQIIPVYGTDFRSTPVFFLQDDHDHFENDAATDRIVTFPVDWFQLQLARATQHLYYPEFLPEEGRPGGLPWSNAGSTGDLSESFGTIRYGRLAEILLYDVRRTMSLNGPDAVFVDRQVERWLLGRAGATDARHLVHVPSNPPGWSAGKWGEWYPDILPPDSDKITTSIPKPYWQEGWLRQHDRLFGSLSEMPGRIPLVVSGDLHAVALGRISRAGSLDLRANPITTVLSGPIGTSPAAFPSAVRGVGPTPPAHLDLSEAVPPIEQHGFTIVDFLPDRIVLHLFRWDVDSEPIDTIDRLEPFYTEVLEPRS